MYRLTFHCVKKKKNGQYSIRCLCINVQLCQCINSPYLLLRCIGKPKVPHMKFFSWMHYFHKWQSLISQSRFSKSTIKYIKTPWGYNMKQIYCHSKYLTRHTVMPLGNKTSKNQNHCSFNCLKSLSLPKYIQKSVRRDRAMSRKGLDDFSVGMVRLENSQTKYLWFTYEKLPLRRTDIPSCFQVHCNDPASKPHFTWENMWFSVENIIIAALTVV